MNCLSLEFFLYSFLGPLLIAENGIMKPWQEGTIVNTTTCIYLHLGTQHITSSSLFLLMLPRSTTSYLVGDLRTPPPNRDGHRCLRGKQRCGSSSKMSDHWVQAVFACLASVQCLPLSCLARIRALEECVVSQKYPGPIGNERPQEPWMSRTTYLSSLHGLAPFPSFSSDLLFWLLGQPRSSLATVIFWWAYRCP